ncbi:hypothetical protein ABT324_29425 [Saccharopolyspora sp. NPDC000359]
MKSYCGATTDAAELHAQPEVDWIREKTCTTCWHVLTTKPS